MNNPSIVFDKLEIRAKSEQSNPALDRISIRDYIKEVEIGADEQKEVAAEALKDEVFEILKVIGLDTEKPDMGQTVLDNIT